MLKYKLIQNNRSNSKTKGKWYARTVVNQTIGIDELAQHMSQHNTPFSKGAIKGVLTDMVACIRELTLEGTAIKIPDLAIFSVGINTSGANSADDFTVAQNVKAFHLRARATGVFTRKELESAVKLSEQDVYTSGRKPSDNGGAQDSGEENTQP